MPFARKVLVIIPLLVLKFNQAKAGQVFLYLSLALLTTFSRGGHSAMLNFFKSNNLGVIFTNVVLIILYRVLFFFHPVDLSYIYRHAEPASKLFLRVFHIGAATPLIWLLLGGAILVFIESLLVNHIINSYRVTTKKNYIGGVLFVVFTSMFPECMVLSPALIATLLLLLCIDKIFELAKPEKLNGHIFDLGFYSGLAMLFYFPAVYFLIFVSIGFFMMRSVTFRERAILLTGFASVLSVVFTIYFWFDSLPEMVLDIVNFQNRIPLTLTRLSHWQIAAVIWMAVLALWLMAFIPGLLFSSVIQIRKYISLLAIGAALSLFALPLAFNFNLSHLLFFSTSLSILYAVYFVETKTNLISEILFIVLILSVFLFEYLPLFITI